MSEKVKSVLKSGVVLVGTGVIVGIALFKLDDLKGGSK